MVVVLQSLLIMLVYKLLIYVIVYYVIRNGGLRTDFIINKKTRSRCRRLKADTILREFFSWFDNKQTQLQLFLYSESVLVYYFLHETGISKLVFPLDITEEFNSDEKKFYLSKG